MAGISHTSRVNTTMAASTTLKLMSFDVRSFDVLRLPAIPFMAPPKVLIIRGSDLIRLIIPPAAKARRPIYRI